MKYVATLHVRPRREVRDPQGDAVAGALRSIGLTVEGVRVGKELLANPVVEDFTVDLRADGA